MSGADAEGNPRYVPEQGTDASWLVVDRGTDRGQRTAISREGSEETARQEASTLSTLEDVTSNLDSPSEWSDIDRVVEDFAAAVVADYNYNHLLHQPPE